MSYIMDFLRYGVPPRFFIEYQVNEKFFFQDCELGANNYIELNREGLDLKSLTFYPWINSETQLTFYINLKYLMPFSRILIRPTASGFTIVMIGVECNFECYCDIVKPEIE